VLCRKGGVGTWVLLYFYSRLIYGNYLMLVEVICTYTEKSSLNLCTGRPPTECDDTRCCIIQF